MKSYNKKETEERDGQSQEYLLPDKPCRCVGVNTEMPRSQSSWLL